MTLLRVSFAGMLGGTTIDGEYFSWPWESAIGSRAITARDYGDTELCCLDGSYLSEYQLSD